MHNFFKKTGTPGYVYKVQGFSLPYEAIFNSAGVYKELHSAMSVNHSREEIDDLMFDEGERRQYSLYKVARFIN